MKKLEIAFAKTAAEAEKFMCQGYCRCCFGCNRNQKKYAVGRSCLCGGIFCGFVLFNISQNQHTEYNSDIFIYF